MGTGSNEISVNGMSGSARVMAGMAMVNLGDGNNHVVVAGLSNGSRIITGTGSDTIDN